MLAGDVDDLLAELRATRHLITLGQLPDDDPEDKGVATLMTLLAVVTMSPTVSGQFETLIEMVVILVVMAYAAAGLSLLLGTPERPATRRERVLGMGALVACGLLVYSTPGKTLVGGLVIALLAWAAYRGFARRPPPPAR